MQGVSGSKYYLFKQPAWVNDLYYRDLSRNTMRTQQQRGMKRRNPYATAWDARQLKQRRVALPTRPITVVPRSYGNARAVTERKYYDSVYAATTIPVLGNDWASTEVDPATLNCLFAPIQGDDISNRQGRKIRLLGLRIKGTLSAAPQADQTAADNGGEVRILLVQDKQSNGAQLNGEDVLAASAGNNPMFMFQNTANFGRFKIWKDKHITMPVPGITYDGTNIEQTGVKRTFKWNISFKKPIIIHYNSSGSTETIAAVVDNSFHLLAGQAGLTTALNYRCRAVYEDV